ncbi:MAG: hypothetical protein JNJ60_11615, partial [Rhodocyclaceae bacterium]|nr:hypothetical protein [Rhodocyclaceae bacterium]
MQFGAEWGAPVLVALLALLWLGGRRLWFAMRAEGDLDASVRGLVLAGLAASLAGALTQSLVDGIFVVPVSEFMFFALAGWAAGLCQIEHPHASAPRTDLGTRLRPIAVLVVLGAVVWLSVFAAHFMPQLKARADATFASTQMLLPRFWVDGRLVW